MTLTRTKLTLSAAVALVLSSAGWLVRADSPKVDEKPARIDVYGDNLPDGAVSRLGTLRWRHSTPVSYVAYSPDGKEVITASQDGAIRVWEASTGKELRKFGKVINTGVQQLQMEALRKAVMPIGMNTLSLSPDGKSAVVVGQDASYTVWDVTTGKEIKTIKPNPQVGANFLVFAPDGRSFFARSYDGFIRQFDVAEAKELRKFGGPPNAQNRTNLAFGNGGLTVSPDGKTLLAAAFEFNNNQLIGSVKSWDIESGKENAAGKGPSGQGNFNSVAYSPDTKFIAWGHYTGTIHIWDIAANKEVALLTPPQPIYPMNMTFSADGRNLAVRSGDQSVRLWSVMEGKVRLTLSESPQAGAQLLALAPYGFSQSNLAFSPDGKRLAMGTGANTVLQWDAGTGKEVAVESGGHQGPVTHLAISLDGKSVLTRAGDNLLRVWDVTTGKESARHKLPPTAVYTSFSGDGKVVALGAYDGTVTIWDSAAGKETKQWKAGNQVGQGFSFLTISPDGKTVAVRGYDNSIRLWDTGTGRELRQLAMVAGGGDVGVAANAKRAIAYRPMTNILVFSPDGTMLAGIGYDNAGMGANRGLRPAGVANVGSLRLWDVATGKQVRRFDEPKNNVGIAAFAFAPDGRTLATANYDGNITLWESASGKERATISTKPAQPAQPGVKMEAMAPGFGPMYGVPALNCIAYSPDGRLLAFAGNDGLVRVCDSITGKEAASFKGHQAGVLTLSFAAGGKYLASGSSDTTALVWETPALPNDRPQGLNIEDKQAEALWADLADADAVKAFAAIRMLSQVPQKEVPLLKDRVQPVPPPDAQKLTQLVADLDSNAFVTRKKAEEELEKMGELAEDALRKALDGKPNLEMQKRLEGLLSKLVTGAAPNAHQLQTLRALEVLEAAGTPEAKEVLQSIAKGAPGARVTRDAQGALDRLGKR